MEHAPLQETIAEKRFSLKGASVVALVSGLIGVTISSMTVYADIDQRITENERGLRVQANRIEEVTAEVRLYRGLDPRLKGIETDIQWIKRALGGERP